MPIVTACVRTYDGRLCFHRCVSVQLSGGGVYPIPGLDGGGGYPIPGLGGWGGGEVPHPRSGWWRGDTPSQVWMVGGNQGTPHHPDLGYPPPSRPEMGYPLTIQT